MSNRTLKAALALVAAVLSAGAGAQTTPEGGGSTLQALSEGVSLDQKLGGQVPVDVRLIDEAGKDVVLAQYLGDRPVIMALVYYKCPKICNQVLNGILASLRAVKRFDAGKEFDVVLVSIDPAETPRDAAQKKTSYMVSYNRPTASEGWHFLTGSEEQVRRLADSVGYRYKWDDESEQYVHPAGIMVLTPQGKIGQYFYGIEYNTRHLEMALIESSENRIGTFVDVVITFCMAYDPATGAYGFVIMRVLRLAGIITVLILGLGIGRMVMNERRSARAGAQRNGEAH